MNKALCVECNLRPPYFRVRGGPIKLDHLHTLCQACFRNLRNSIKAPKSKNREEISMSTDFLNATNIIHIWEDRHLALQSAINDGIFTLQGKDLPDPEDPTDPQFTVRIIISGTGAGTEFLYGEQLIATDVPAINVNCWSKRNFSYLKHWISKVLDDPSVYRGNEIHFVVLNGTSNWSAQFRK